MCLILFAIDQHPAYRLILAANRDEFYDRPTKSMHIWPDKPGILAGRDLKGGGTWLGITRNQRFAALTNFRDPANIKFQAPSRGMILTDFLESSKTPQAFLSKLSKSSDQFNGFNLLLSDRNDFFYFSSQTGEYQKLKPGFYGLSNHHLNTDWPKVKKGTQLLKKSIQALDGMVGPKADILFEILKDTTFPPDKDLPDTGIGFTWEKLLSPIFIQSPEYGTRSSSVILMDMTGSTRVLEQNFNQNNYKTTSCHEEHHFEI